MLRSMTGYGQGESVAGEHTVVAEVKSVNNRYRDIVVRIPRSLQSLEDELRAQVALKMKRGRFDVTAQVVRKEGQDEAALDINMPLARSYFRILSTLCDEFGLEKAIRPEEICQMKDVISYKPEELNLEEIREGLKSALDKALENCDAMRIKEGYALEEDLRSRVNHIEKCLDEIQGKASLVTEEWRKKMREKIRQIVEDVQIDEARLAQEIVYSAERSDITEEIVRSRSHLVQFRNAMSGDEPVGRKLEFLIQELHRETNTIGSKASDTAISAAAVEIKVELEKLREQVQNVE
ncbi:MAG: YicC family protein [Deltaproteobacteria bacterium HGW-Deltaproteobacteria-21]|jgi:uncharacterized protein (TIGR00255 family)|nr:MAG: YicC family protein [Deltaproteobacteria bacterium HGW-Deltaproteobacteria-21]PKN64624.1 MAG: YicC family protein [Deltaproteobacteria bacterium HGW-Deltaproteobacteria-15]